METLKLTLIALPIVEIAIFILILLLKDKKQKKGKPVLDDDAPGHYEEYEFSERPFINL